MKSFFLTSSVLAAVATAQSGGRLGGGAGPEDRVVDFTAANQNPNATGSASLFGVDMTIPPSQIFTTPWTIAVNVSEVPGRAPDHASDVQTNSVLSLNANGNFLPNATLWTTCAIVMQGITREATVDGNSDAESGNCTTTLGSQCTSDWQEALRNSRGLAARDATLANGTGACGGMSMPDVPASCTGRFTLNTLSQDIDSRNYTEGQAFIYQVSDYYSPTNTSTRDIYNTAVTKIWGVVLLQTASYAFNQGGGSTWVRMACVRANMTREGSRVVDNVPGRAAGTAKVSVLAIIGAVAFIGLLL